MKAQSMSSLFLAPAGNEPCASILLTATASCLGLTLPDRVHFPTNYRRLWNLAPLEEDLRSGWLLNGPFAVDPGRGRLAGSIADRQEIFRRLGRTFGDRLLKLHDLATADWSTFASALDLDASEHVARNLFWSRLFDVFGPDFDDDLARHLHINGHGYGLLAAERPVVPTHLPQPFDAPVRASEVDHFTDAALSEPAVLEKVRGWRALADLEGRTVASDVAGQLKKTWLRWRAADHTR